MKARELVPTKPKDETEPAQPGDLDYEEAPVKEVAEVVKADPGPTTSPASHVVASHPLASPVASVEGNQFAPVHGFVTICKVCATEVTHRTNNASKVPGMCAQPGCRGPLQLVAEIP